MRVIIDDRFFEFQNERTEQIFTEQKSYLKALIEKYQNAGDMEALVTTLLSLSNLTEGLINEMVEEVGADQVAKYLKAKEI
jgi:hypothetical protein